MLQRSSDILSSADLLEFIGDMEPGLSPKRMMSQALKRCRTMTGAEAGTMFEISGYGKNRYLRPVCMQNDKIRLRMKDFYLPVASKTIAGHIAVSENRFA